MNFLETLRNWFELRKTRERLLVLGLSLAFWYLIFSLFLFRPIDNEQAQLDADIKVLDSQAKNWQTQIATLNKLGESAIYQRYLEQQKIEQRLRQQYKMLLKTSPSKQWKDVIHTILQSQPNILILDLKNLPEAPYSPNAAITSKIYQQQLKLTINANFFSTVDYLDYVEKNLPGLHWNSLHYQVLQYPLAKVAMEFSILYEKP